jgi:hypothetical protein
MVNQWLCKVSGLIMEPFADIYEVITFISLFFIAVAVIPYIFAKIGEWLGY